jgi:hypothetical protein
LLFCFDKKSFLVLVKIVFTFLEIFFQKKIQINLKPSLLRLGSFLNPATDLGFKAKKS